ncbi:MAG: hypothetical protein KAJ19_29345, partial [Gammaproteobacteria bacterium]|nr:hypothetical protein [Gammaproteobacteria bacterium]
YTTNEGSSWIQEATNEADYQTYDWTAPNTPEDGYQVRVVAVDSVGSTATDESDSTFTVYRIGNAQGVVLWNKLDDVTAVQNSEIGIDGIETGTIQYNAGKFGDGSYTNSTDNRINFQNFTSSSVNDWQEFTMEFWFKTDYDVEDGVALDGNVYTLYNWRINDENRNLSQITNDYRGWQYFIEVSNTVYRYTNTTISFTSEEAHHFAVVVNNSGIDGGDDKVRMYLDNDLTYNLTTTHPSLSGTQDLLLLVHLTAGGYTTPFNGLMDNIKIYNYAKTDFSDRFYEGFETNAPTLEVLTPSAAGITLEAGSTYEVTWTATDESGFSANDNYITIRYTTNDATWTTITTLEENDQGTVEGSYVWTVPAILTTEAKISIEVTDNTGLTDIDTSDNTFEIADTAGPAITVLSPDGGTTDESGTSIDITWIATDEGVGTDHVDIYYTTNEGASWTLISNDEANDGSYSGWTPTTAEDGYQIRVVAYDTLGNNATDESDSTFTI